MNFLLFAGSFNGPSRLGEPRQAEADRTRMFYVYVLQSLKYAKTYVGHTDDIYRRLEEHNRGHSAYTKRYKPWRIIYTEEFLTEKEAIDRERYYKSHAGRVKLQKIVSHCGVVQW